MTFSPFGVLTILYIFLNLFYNFFARKNSVEQVYFKFFILSFVYSLIFDVGYIAEISDFVIEYNYLFSIVNFILAFCVLIKKGISKKFLTVFSIFIGYILTITVIPYLLGVGYVSVPHDKVWDTYFSTKIPLPTVTITGTAFFVICRVFIFLVNFYAFTKTFTQAKVIIILKSVYRASVFVIIGAVIEIIISNLIDPFLLRKIAYSFFGHSEATYDVSKSFGAFFSPMLFMREPSSFAFSLFFFAINSVAYLWLDRKKKNALLKLNILLLCCLLIISFSMSSLIYLVAIAVLSVYLFGTKKGITIIAVFAVAILIAVNILYSQRIDNIFNWIKRFKYSEPKDLPAVSEVIRFYSIYNNTVLFLKNPLFGCGVSSIYCFSAIITLFSNIGILGVILYCNAVKSITDEFFKVKKFSWLTLLILFIAFILTGHMSQILYIEKIIYLYIILKFLQLNKNTRIRNVKLSQRNLVNE